MKLGTDIQHMSGHCRKGYQDQRSKVKIMIRPSAMMAEACISTMWRRGSFNCFHSLRQLTSLLLSKWYCRFKNAHSSR